MSWNSFGFKPVRSHEARKPESQEAKPRSQQKHEAKKPKSHRSQQRQQPRSQEAKKTEARSQGSQEAKKSRSHQAQKARSHQAQKPPLAQPAKESPLAKPGKNYIPGAHPKSLILNPLKPKILNSSWPPCDVSPCSRSPDPSAKRRDGSPGLAYRARGSGFRV